MEGHPVTGVVFTAQLGIRPRESCVKQAYPFR
jgi:hypothetical protein